jgi:hypothetical protein
MEGLEVSSAVFQQVAYGYVTRRLEYKKRRLAWHQSSGARRLLSWIQFQARSLTYHAGRSQFQSYSRIWCMS